MSVRTAAATWFAFLGCAVIAWWSLLFLYPASRQWFQMGHSDEVLVAFRLPDLLLAAGALSAAVLTHRQSSLAVPACWFVTGLVSYASLYCLTFALDSDTGWLGVVTMLPAMVWCGNFATAITPALKTAMFRVSRDATTGWIILKTLVQIVVVWSLILVVFPMLIVEVEAKLGVPSFRFPYQKAIAGVLFVPVSLLGLASAYEMGRTGRGTPLPFDTARSLVVGGTYAYVRNPMAISGVGQGLLVGILRGSSLVVAYALMGAAIWQLIYRKLEEDDLSARFGDAYARYRHSVKTRIPRLSRYQPDPNPGTGTQPSS